MAKIYVDTVDQGDALPSIWRHDGISRELIARFADDQ